MFTHYNYYTTGTFRNVAGAMLRDIRVRIYDMSQADFAKHVLHCSAGHVSGMELGRFELSAAAKDLLKKYDDEI